MIEWPTVTRTEKLTIGWLIFLVVAVWAIWKCAGVEVRKSRYPTQGSGARLLLDPPRLKAIKRIPFLPTKAIPVIPVEYYFAATAQADGLESDYSNEVVYTRTNYTPFVTLAWDRSPGTNVVTNYVVWLGTNSGQYTQSFAAGTNLTLTVRILPPPLTNYVVTVSTTLATNLQYRTGFSGAWTRLNATNWTATNPPAPRYWRAMGKSSKVFISIRWQ